MNGVVVEIRNVPVHQNRVFRDRDLALACPRGDVLLAPDPISGLLHNAAFDPALAVYDSSYQNDALLSPTYQSHLSSVADLLDESVSGKKIFEVGCGKAGFLNILSKRGYSTSGCDPAYEGSEPSIVKKDFSADLLPRDTDCVILRHVLEYIANPFGFLETLANAVKPESLIFIEAPNLDYILGGNGWLNINYEYVYYYRSQDLAGLFGDVRAQGELFGGEYVYVLARLSSLQPYRSSNMSIQRMSIDEKVQGLMGRAHGNARAMWGCAGKGAMFAHHMQSAGFPLMCAIDINPAKQGGFLPGTGLRIDGPSEGMRRLDSGDTMFVMNSKYMDEIRQASYQRFAYVAV